MKTIFRICCLILLLSGSVLFCFSQADTLNKVVANKRISEYFTLQSFNSSHTLNLSSLNNLHMDKNQPRFSFYASPSKGFMIYDNSRNEYFPTYQKNINMDLNSSLMIGGIDYLLLLIDKKGKYFEIKD